MKRRYAAGILVLLLAATLAPVPANGAGEEVVLAVLGETHGTRTITKEIVSRAAARGATGCVCPGDFIYGHSSSTPALWKDMMRPFMGLMMPAQGNHDWPWEDWKPIFPGGKPYYAKDVNGVQFVSLNPEQASLKPGSTQRAWLESTLASRGPEALKVVFLHRPWWLPSAADHPYTEFESRAQTSAESMHALMKKHGVDLVVSAHEKNYQHSLRDGIHYVVAGGAGPEWDKYALDYALPGAVKRLTTPVGSILRVTPTGLAFESFDERGGFVEKFSIAGGAPPPQDGPYAPTFTPHDGNEWWVQVRLTEAAAKVEARVDGGAWRALTLRSWGSWAASLHAPDGSHVEFRATRADGATATSGAYAWPDGKPVGSGAFSAAFRPYDGNEWWIQTEVEASMPLKSVDARVDGGAWRALTLRTWGAWAASFHAPTGSEVEFRATGATGATATSPAFTWPDGTPARPSPAVTFHPYDGNEWWVQTKVETGEDVTRVEARVDGGPWRDLPLRSWGAWAAGMRAPTGSQVEFRATLASGATATSEPYAWPVP